MLLVLTACTWTNWQLMLTSKQVLAPNDVGKSNIYYILLSQVNNFDSVYLKKGIWGLRADSLSLSWWAARQWVLQGIPGCLWAQTWRHQEVDSWKRSDLQGVRITLNCWSHGSVWKKTTFVCTICVCTPISSWNFSYCNELVNFSEAD